MWIQDPRSPDRLINLAQAVELYVNSYATVLDREQRMNYSVQARMVTGGLEIVYQPDKESQTPEADCLKWLLTWRGA